jgi:hypothetical protein
MIKSSIVSALKLSKAIFCYLLVFFLLNINESLAFVGGTSMGYGSGASSAGTPSIKSGISIVDPEGKSYNCEPFVDKKWETTSFEDSWNGVYFSLGYEASKFSGGFKIEDSSPAYYRNLTGGTDATPIFSDIGKKNSFSGSSSMPVINVGGGFLIDRMYLATDLEIRTLPLQFTKKMKVYESVINSNGAETQTEGSETTLTYSLSNYAMFNAKIGYLVTNRSMVYLNAGIGSFSSSSIKTDGKYGVLETSDGDNPPPIRLSLGTEFLLSNHFRFLADYSYWIVPQNMGSFYLNKKTNSNPMARSENSYVADFKINSLKLGILYRF